MAEPLVLTFDIGTQSARAVLVDKKGNIVAVNQKKYSEPYFSLNPGWAEQKPDFYYDRMCEAAKELCSENADKLRDIFAVTFTCIRDSVVCLDKDKKPVRDVILWLDKRQADYKKQIPLINRLLFGLVGMGESVKILYKATFSNWIKQNEPEVWAKTDKYVMLPTYLNYKLTGNLIDSASNLIGHFPFNYKDKHWMSSKELTYCVCDIPEQRLCKLIKTGEVIGILNDEICKKTGIPAGLPLIATGSDKGCETLGLSVYNPGKASVSFGTSSTVQLAVSKYFEPQKFMPAYPAVPDDRYNPEIQVFRGFWLVSWFIREFAAEERLEAERLGTFPEAILDEKIKDIPAGSDGLLLQPYWTPGITKPNSLGAIIGFSDFHTRLHLYKAIIEGLCLELYDSMNIMQKRSGIKIEEVFVGGGGSKSDVVCQIAADVFGLPVKRIQTHEACSVGSSMVAFVSKGEFKDYEEAIKSMSHETDVFTPDAANHEIYEQLYTKAYRRIFPKLAPLYKSILEIYKRR
ncbi:MAG: FGGY-family carbohydrate kinase [Clostridia bacterium]|nr:FGGY-family carbohydrate kinase [Clostridia bacterium]